MFIHFYVNPYCDPIERHNCKFSMDDTIVCQYDIETPEINSAKTISTIYKPDKDKKKALQEEGFRLKGVNDGVYTYERDGRAIVRIKPKENSKYVKRGNTNEESD